MIRRLILCFLFLSLSAVATKADICRTPLPQANATQPLPAIRIVPTGDNYSAAAGTTVALAQAIAHWNSVCGSNVPPLSTTASSTVVFTIRYVKGAYNLTLRTDACAGTSRPPANTVLGSGTITIFETSRDGGDCTNRYLEFTLHEIGHRLGLDHSICVPNIMWDGGLLVGSRPAAADCNAVDEFWLTNQEVQFPLPNPFFNCSFDSDCVKELGPPPDNGRWLCIGSRCVPSLSPLVIYLPNYLDTLRAGENWWEDGFCDAGSPTVCLDWMGNGAIACTSWTAPESKIAFVVSLSDQDRNHLEQGLEIRAEPWRHFFGNVTMAPRGGFPYAHGFEALAAHCKTARGTSQIDFAECGKSLHAWADRNADGEIEQAELIEFSDLGISSLCDVRETPKGDKCGNQFPVESDAVCARHPGKCGTWLDIFFTPVESFGPESWGATTQGLPF